LHTFPAVPGSARLNDRTGNLSRAPLSSATHRAIDKEECVLPASPLLRDSTLDAGSPVRQAL
jgi:hypothetical protein